MPHKWIDEGTLRWCWPELGSAPLMLQEISQATARFLGAGSQSRNRREICFSCEDALAICRETTSQRTPARKPFVGKRM